VPEPGLTGQQIVFFIILIAAFALLLTEKLRNDLVAVLIVLALAVTGLLEPKEAISGFSSEPAIVVAAIFVLSSALHLTGVSDMLGAWIGRLAGSSFARMIAVIMPAVALLSAFTHHLTTTAVMLPVMLELSRSREIPPSKLLMPLSFAASLGTTITIIGAPAFLIASGILQQAGRPGLSVFSIAPIGLALSLMGTIFVLLTARFLLPERQGAGDNRNFFRLDNYFTEVTVLPGSPFLEKTVEELHDDRRYQFSVVGWLREGRPLRRPYVEERLQEGDVLLVRTTPDEIIAFRREPGVELQPVAKYEDETHSPDGEVEDVSDRLVQAVVAPNADFLGRTIGEIDLRRRFGAIVVALWRQQGWLQQELSQTRLRPGDILVLQGNSEALSRVESDPAFLMLTPFQGEGRLRRKASLAALIMVVTILLAALNILSIEIAGLAGAAAMVLSGCLTPRQAYRAIDTRIFVFIAGAIPLGLAMQSSGAAEVLGGLLQRVVGGWNEFFVLLALFAVVGILTQFMSDSATTALFAPVAVALAQALGQPPEPYVVTVAMAAVASFLTPIGHHGNLLIYAPGGYRFADFVRVGTPLTVLVGLVVVFLAPMLWPE
jgi:di/tricarboxylate transporter